MIYAITNFVLIYLFPKKSTSAFIWLNLTSGQQVLFSDMKRVPDWPRKQPTSNGQKCRDSRVVCRHHKSATKNISKVPIGARHWDSEPQRDSRSLDKLPGHMRSQDTYTLQSKTAQLPVMNDKWVAETERCKRSKKESERRKDSWERAIGSLHGGDNRGLSSATLVGGNLLSVVTSLSFLSNWPLSYLPPAWCDNEMRYHISPRIRGTLFQKIWRLKTGCIL